MNRLGIDIGRVIIAGGSGAGDTSFFSGDTTAMLRTPAVPDAFEAIARLVPLFGEAWLVSKCGPRVQERSLEWLRHHRFFERTAITPVVPYRYLFKDWETTEAAVRRDLQAERAAGVG
ncbi:hypothetical protein [Kribbella speibonae]|uniref:hypothetical protein n=1 Tax=Kribbella speibonae TaxID=1572660 RepID=UPI00192D2DDA|nr:hypothetical protein [Kribbella speibonae]